MPATQRKCMYGGSTLDVDRQYIGSVTATTHQEKGILTLESNPSRGTVLPAPHGKGSKCDKNVKYKRTDALSLKKFTKRHLSSNGPPFSRTALESHWYAGGKYGGDWNFKEAWLWTCRYLPFAKTFPINRINQRPRTGRPRATTRADDRTFCFRHLRNRFLPATSSTNLPQGRRVSDRTIRRRLCAANPRPRRPYRGPFLTQRHRQERLRWCNARRRWRLNVEWSKTLFSDESRFSLYHSDGRARVYRRTGERYADNMTDVLEVA